ncbi:hypothetical protein R3P38DRAFT_3501001 [Favolaschia claudopus]|uniref:Uncharacterized protein n=1 Tax=Favolaschia claudopus TaxID=2862362 RepID=A0AAV9Z4W4_9AGAR
MHTRELNVSLPSRSSNLLYLFAVSRRSREAVSLPRNQSQSLSLTLFSLPSITSSLATPVHTPSLPTPIPIPTPMPRAEPTTPSRRRAARPSHSARPPKLARTAASVAAAAAASSPPHPSSFPLPSASASASAPLPTKTTPTKSKGKAKSDMKSIPKKKDAAATWRHPAELPYIRSPSGKHGAWDDMAIVRFLVAKAGFSIPPRSSSPSDEFFQVHFPATSLDSNQDSETKTITLPLPYRLPLLWTAKYLWTSLHLVLTADPTIRDAEWRETRFEMLHLARLIEVLLSGARGEGVSQGGEKKEDETLSADWRCPAFDRALRRFWHHWLISRDEFVRDFWREFGEEEFEGGDVLELAWPRWVLKGHKGFLLTKAEVANGIDVQGFLRGFWVDEERGEFGYPEADNLKKDGEAKLLPESSESRSKGNGNDVEGGGGGEDEDGSKKKSKKKVVKKPRPSGSAEIQHESVRPRNATTTNSLPEASKSSSKEKEEVNASIVDSMVVDGDLSRSHVSPDEEIPLDPPLPHSTTSTPRPSPSQRMYIEVPPLAAGDPRRNIGRRPIERDRATAMGSVRPGTGRVVGFVGGDDEEKSQDGDENAGMEDEDVDVSMKPRGEEEEGVAKGKEDENDESSLDLDSDLELGYPDEVESTPPVFVPPSEHEKENLNEEYKGNSEPSLSRSVSPVLPPLSSARFPPPAPTPTIPSAFIPPTQPPPQLTRTPPPPQLPNPTPDAVTHFLHSFTALTTELHALRAEVADLRRSRDLTTPVVLQLEERVRRVEGRLSASGAGNSGVSVSASALGGVGGNGLSGGGEGEGEATSAWAHPLAHLVSLPDAMDVDVLPRPQTIVEEGKLTKKRKSAGGASGSGSGGKKRNTTTPIMTAGDSAAGPELVPRAKKVGRR